VIGFIAAVASDSTGSEFIVDGGGVTGQVLPLPQRTPTPGLAGQTDSRTIPSARHGETSAGVPSPALHRSRVPHERALLSGRSAVPPDHLRDIASVGSTPESRWREEPCLRTAIDWTDRLSPPRAGP
jgi:hypothetical protein